MKWNKKSKPCIHVGERRIIEKFLFFPKCLWNIKEKKYEYRWLEFAKIEQEYRRVRYRNNRYWSDMYWGFPDNPFQKAFNKK